MRTPVLLPHKDISRQCVANRAETRTGSTRCIDVSMSQGKAALRLALILKIIEPQPGRGPVYRSELLGPTSDRHIRYGHQVRYQNLPVRPPVLLETAQAGRPGFREPTNITVAQTTHSNDYAATNFSLWTNGVLEETGQLMTSSFRKHHHTYRIQNKTDA